MYKIFNFVRNRKNNIDFIFSIQLICLRKDKNFFEFLTFGQTLLFVSVDTLNEEYFYLDQQEKYLNYIFFSDKKIHHVVSSSRISSKMFMIFG